ncbi:hypothetical protein [Candidatus Villigracilis saccharophilus]|uniref:ABC transporter permease n=1 Tax=Candidatus Villigracilis saccharophilus TaxID=3140684 RepID=UPI003135847C|nr:hypothetical protein [Anaerolineales bacterium]
MSRFIGVFRHEFNMSIRRSGMWIAYGLLFLFYTVSVLWPSPDERDIFTDATLWQFAGQLAYTFNLFLPVAAGILAADRMQRDFRVGVHELQSSTPLSNLVYILGKYFGVLAASLAPVLVWIWVVTAGLVATGNAPINLIFAMTVTFFAMIVPCLCIRHCLLTGMSAHHALACVSDPVHRLLVLGKLHPARNFPHPQRDIAHRRRDARLSRLLRRLSWLAGPADLHRHGCNLNLLVLGLCITAVMVVLNYYLQWQSRRA